MSVVHSRTLWVVKNGRKSKAFTTAAAAYAYRDAMVDMQKEGWVK